jgi:hypothetical protein
MQGMAAAFALLAWTTGAAAQTLDEQARTFLAQGMTPEAAASRLVSAGTYPEEVAAVLFRLAPGSVRAVAFIVARDSARTAVASVVPLAAELAGLAQPATVPVGAAIALSAPDQAAASAAVLAQVVPQAAPLIAAAMAKLAPSLAAEIAAAAAGAVPQQAIFIAAAVAFARPEAKAATFGGVARAIGSTAERVALLAEASELVGANAVREAEEALAGLPLGRPVR